MIEIYKKLKELEKYQDNWDSYGAPAPNQIAFDMAKKILDLSIAKNFISMRIAPSVEGGIALGYKNEDRYADFECFNDGDIVVMFMDKDKIYSIFEVKDDLEIEQAIKQISIFIEK